jgi:hypothetical protein
MTFTAHCKDHRGVELLKVLRWRVPGMTGAGAETDIVVSDPIELINELQRVDRSWRNHITLVH